MIGFMFLLLALTFGATVLFIGYLENKRKGYNMPEEAPYTTSSNCGTVVIDYPRWHHLAIVKKKGKKYLFLNGQKLIIKGDYTIDFWSQDPLLEKFAKDLAESQNRKEK